MARSAPRMLLRCTSVGWAVSTGETSSGQRAHDALVLDAGFGEEVEGMIEAARDVPSLASWRARCRRLWQSSARLARCEK